MSRVTDRDLLQDAVDWLARLPFLGRAEMSMLLGIGEARVGGVLRRLEEVGWTESVVPSSPELEPQRLYVLPATAQARLAESRPSSPLPIGRRETLARLARIETTVGLNRFLAELAFAVAEDVEVDLADARSLPWNAGRASRCWPPEVEAYACLRWGPWVAPFFIAWDRAEAPPIHRRKRVSGWYTYAQSHGWDIPSILVVCPSEREAEQWARAVMNSADRRGCPLLTMFLATTVSAQTDPLGAIWRRVDGTMEALLCERLRWVPQGSEPLTSRRLTQDLDLSQLAANAAPLREWAVQVADHLNGASGLERAAALSLAIGPLQKTTLEWIGHHPLLTSSDLATLMELREPLAEKLLSDLGDRGLVRPLAQRTDGESAPPRRHVLMRDGLRLLAARDGVPPRRYARYGVLAAPGDGKTGRRLETLVTQFDHTVGANSFFIRLTRDVRTRGGRLLRWLNASESTEQFTYYGQRRWLRPDGYAEIELNGKVQRFFLEWDRGTTRWPDVIEKFRIYADYFFAGPGGPKPHVLVVTTSPLREKVIWHVLDATFHENGSRPGLFFTSVDSLTTRVGPLSPVWRRFGSNGREEWPGAGPNVETSELQSPRESRGQPA